MAPSATPDPAREPRVGDRGGAGDEALERLAALPAADHFQLHQLTAAADPRRLLADPARHDVVASYERPDQGLAIVGIGSAARVELRPNRGPASLRAEAAALLGERSAGNHNETAPGGLRPRLLGGFRFNPRTPPAAPWTEFGYGWLTLPRVLLVTEGETTGAVLAPGVAGVEAAASVEAAFDAPAGSGDPRPRSWTVERPVDRERWLTSVAEISSEVREGEYEKAVLATTQQLRAASPVDLGSTLARLRAGYPNCHLFTMSSGGATFLGASPELLVSISGGRARSLGLAGSLGRGETPEEDERLGEQLMSSAKDRIEHETVVRAIRERLGPAVAELHAPNAPQLRKLRNIQHLSTEITGRVRPDVDILDLVERLHPTPAVCGWPTDIARAVIESHEQFDRGWYAGPVGWMDANGEGEFAVALRSALVRDERAWLFAGNGIMGDSAPEAELAEVSLKFRPLSEALGA